MRFHAHLLVSWLVLAGGISSLAGCGSNKSLGEGFPEDAGAGGTGGTTSVTTVTGGGATAGVTSAASFSVGGSSAGATSAAAGQTSGASSAGAGTSATGSSSQGTSTGTAGAVAGTTATGSASGATGGTSSLGGGSGGASGSTGSSDGTGVILTATVLDTGTIQATWKNNTQASIFLYGCGTVDVYRKDATGWTNIGKPMACGWEGVAPEVKPGASLNDAFYGPFDKWWPGTGGIFRVSGEYGVGCTNPSAGQSNAGCTAFYQATSNEVTVTMPVADAGVDVGCKDIEGVTCKKPGGGCAAMTCVNGSWACAPGQTPVALVPGACDDPDASVD